MAAKVDKALKLAADDRLRMDSTLINLNGRM